MPREETTCMVEDATLIFRNFNGNEGNFNDAGKRNFSVVLDPITAKKLTDEGWNVKERAPREEGDEPLFYISVKVSFKVKPPKITVITSTTRTLLPEELVGTLDWAEIKTCDLIVNGSEWSVNGRDGRAAYLKTMFVEIDEDPLEMKWGARLAELDG